uniref:folate gamma-glutamyl hydrolase n=1 Tax=Chromera velia CCMP2878 TaxID=1169474 RepID=A0A0G4HNZ5_9ALVE|eukprot:Cvel_7747.t1-p1 / transcript=Cvel_7747.t1 / gene=Cvel_7747 / organism=Chromera_velia_CCMP2878 / gene_product=Gamma-glutamyl hydrolase, putative / transcript_product=Gamma-glutamyl hydrolase, putative / location=Cvel_scaffold412:61534-66012(+) / protein_length=439 / sequence_SO=supercontig / SO=protein_coding / is_pseudo=false
MRNAKTRLATEKCRTGTDSTLKTVVFFSLICCLLPCYPVSASEASRKETPHTAGGASMRRPVIGVMSQPHDDKEGEGSFIVASYVKYIEAGGARAVPVFFDGDEAYLSRMFSSLNGVLFPGGGNSIAPSTGLYRSHSYFLDRSKQAYDEGDYFPVWGTCQGFEVIAQWGANDSSLIPDSRFDGFNQRSDVEIESCVETETLRESRMFGGLLVGERDGEYGGGEQTETEEEARRQRETSLTKAERSLRGSFRYETPLPTSRDCVPKAPYILRALSDSRSVFYNHEHGVSLEDWAGSPSLSEGFLSLGVSSDKRGKDFVAILEAKEAPIFGVQFHPEKNLFEWDPKKNIPRTEESTAVASYFARFFVDEARKSTHKFPSGKEEAEALIYNWVPQVNVNETTVWEGGYDYEEVYEFPPFNGSVGLSPSSPGTPRQKTRIFFQ